MSSINFSILKEIFSKYSIYEISQAVHIESDKYETSVAAIVYGKIVEKVNIIDKNFKPLQLPLRSNPFYDYYVGYFNNQYDEVIYTNNNITVPQTVPLAFI